MVLFLSMMRSKLPRKIKKQWQLEAKTLNTRNRDLRAAMLKKQTEAPKSPCANQPDSTMLHVVWHGEPAVFSQMQVLGTGAYAKVLQVKHTITGAEYGMKVAKAGGTDASLGEYACRDILTYCSASGQLPSLQTTALALAFAWRLRQRACWIICGGRRISLQIRLQMAVGFLAAGLCCGRLLRG